MDILVYWKQVLLSNWHFMRWLRLALGLFIGVQAFQLHDTLSGFIAAFLLFQVITNTGCCGASGCSVPAPGNNQKHLDEVEYEEVGEGTHEEVSRR